MTNTQKEYNEWVIAKLEGMIEGLMAQRIITKDVYERLRMLVHDIETYVHRLENDISKLSKPEGFFTMDSTPANVKPV